MRWGDPNSVVLRTSIPLNTLRFSQLRALFVGLVVRTVGPLAGLLTAVLVHAHAWAEGTAETGPTQTLTTATVVFVDILDAQREEFEFTGQGSIVVSQPSGARMGTFGSGSVITPVTGETGRYRVQFIESQGAPGWDITVFDTSRTPREARPGRVSSLAWDFDAGGFEAERSLEGSFYVVVPGGLPSTTGVIEVRPDGLAGFEYQVLANAWGVDGDNAGRTVPLASTTATSGYPIYLNPPEVATYASVQPEIEEPSFRSGRLGCSAIEIATSTGTFVFGSNIRGRARVVCDLDENGVFDPMGGGDLNLSSPVIPGTHRIDWDGNGPDGRPVPAGDYPCRIELGTGEMHFIGLDIETIYPGMRMYALNRNLIRTPLRMFWDDTLVQDTAVTMPNGQIGLITSGGDGLDSAPPNEPTVANVNGRAWGNFGEPSKGDESYSDTFAFLARSTSSTLTVTVMDPRLDRDRDQLSDYTEMCVLGTDSLDADSDDDGLSDGEEQVEGRDGFITNPLNADTDGDGLVDGVETSGRPVAPGASAGVLFSGTEGTFVPDRDPTTQTDPTDADSDGGGRPDGDEDRNRNGRVDFNERDPRDPDDDPTRCGDGRIEDTETCDDANLVERDGCSSECIVEDGFTCDDEPSDCSPIFVDTDTDADGVVDRTDNCPSVFNPRQGDLDRDGTGDLCDIDSDGNGLQDGTTAQGGGCGCTSQDREPSTFIGLVMLLWTLRFRHRRGPSQQG